jgi:hypothetical protein
MSSSVPTRGVCELSRLTYIQQVSQALYFTDGKIDHMGISGLQLIRKFCSWCGNYGQRMLLMWTLWTMHKSRTPDSIHFFDIVRVKKLFTYFSLTYSMVVDIAS